MELRRANSSWFLIVRLSRLTCVSTQECRKDLRSFTFTGSRSRLRVLDPGKRRLFRAECLPHACKANELRKGTERIRTADFFPAETPSKRPLVLTCTAPSVSVLVAQCSLFQTTVGFTSTGRRPFASSRVLKYCSSCPLGRRVSCVLTHTVFVVFASAADRLRFARRHSRSRGRPC